MTFREYIIEQLAHKSQRKIEKILIIDGQDLRARQAALLHKMDGYIEPILLEETNEVSSHHHKLGQLEIISISKYLSNEQNFITLTNLYVQKRKGKETLEDAKKKVYDKNVFAMLLLELGIVDGVVGGLHSPTADILRAGFKVIGPKPGISTISSIMIMERAHEWYIFADISVNIDPSIEQLVDIAINACEFARLIKFKTKVAFLSFSTSGSAESPQSLKIRQATELFNKKYPSEYIALGEIQFDAAFDPRVREMKYKDEGFKKNPTIFIFPSLDAGNIGYKIAQRMGGFGAIGPIITGINKPVNDLSRGATVEDVYNTILLTATQVEN